MSYMEMPEIERKEYENKGTVTISSEEYRDILDYSCKLRIYAEREHDDWRKEYSRVNELESKIKTLNMKIDEINKWLDSDSLLKEKFKTWKLEKLAKEQSESEE